MTTADMYAAALEADQADRDFMNAWINEGRTLDDPYVIALRYYRECAESIHDRLISSQVSEISPPARVADPEHIDYPHWPGYLLGCEACERMMQAQAEWEYDNREYLS